MPKKEIENVNANEQLEAEIAEYEKQLQELKKKNDIPALTELLMKPSQMVSNEGMSEKAGRMMESVKNFTRELSKPMDKESKQINPENLNILTQIWRYFCQKTNDLYMKAGKLFDDYEKKLKNREIKDAEPICNEPSKTKKVAQDLMLSEMNNDLNAPFIFRNNFLEPIVSDNDPKISDDLAKKYYDDPEKDKIDIYFSRIEEEENVKYFTDNKIPEDTYIKYKELGQDRNTQEGKTGFYVKMGRAHDDPDCFTSIPKDIKTINDLRKESGGDAKKHEQALNEYEDDIHYKLTKEAAYNAKIQAFVEKLKKLNNEFLDIVKDSDLPKTENFTNYINSVENLNKLGTGDYTACLKNGYYDKKNFMYVKDASLKPATILNAMENFDDDLRYYSNEVYDVVENHKKNEPQTRDEYKNGITEAQYEKMRKIDDIMTEMIDIKDAMKKIGKDNLSITTSASDLKKTLDHINSEKKALGFYMNKPYESEKQSYESTDGMQAVFNDAIKNINDSLAENYVQSEDYDNLTQSMLHNKELYEKMMIASNNNNSEMVMKYAEALKLSVGLIPSLADACMDSDAELLDKDSSFAAQAQIRENILKDFSDKAESITAFAQTMEEEARKQFEQEEKLRAEQEKEKSEQIVKAREEEAQKAKQRREKITETIKAKLDGYKRIKKDENSTEIQKIAAEYAKAATKGLLNTANETNGSFDKETIDETVTLNLAAITAQKIIEKGGEKLPKNEDEFIDFTKGLAANKQFRNSISDIKSSNDVYNLLGDEKGEAKILDNFLTNSKYEKDHPTTTVNTQAPAANKTLSNN